MGIHNRPATCSSTGKRLRMKSWFYRNGKYYYNRRAWVEEQAKLAREGQKAKAEAAPPGVDAGAPAESGEAKTP